MERNEARKLAIMVRDHCRSYEEEGFSCDLCLLYSACVKRDSGYCPPYSGKSPKGLRTVFEMPAELKNGVKGKEKDVMEALEKLDDYAANTECKDCIFCGDECTFSRSTPAGWDIKEV